MTNIDKALAEYSEALAVLRAEQAKRAVLEEQSNQLYKELSQAHKAVFAARDALSAKRKLLDETL